ncbi:MAG: LysR family transcriptional regulator [Acidimicrobiales bacterium]
MALIGTDAGRTTLAQIEALTQAARLGSFAAAAAQLNVSDKHRLIRAVERLASNLHIEGLTSRDGDEPLLPAGMADLEGAGTRLLEAVTEFERATQVLSTHTIAVRCTTYPSMVTIFMAEATAVFEFTESNLPLRRRVHYVDLESVHRRSPGPSVIRPLVSGATDVAVGPTRDVSNIDNIETRELYKWAVVVGVHADHPLREVSAQQGGLTAADLASWSLLVSPHGHVTRELLRGIEPSTGFEIEMETSNTQARAALGRSGLRVPILAGDALTEEDHDLDWPMVLCTDRKGRILRTPDGDVIPLTDSHSVYWRSDRSAPLLVHVHAFVEEIYKCAERLRARQGGALTPF